MIEHFPMRFLAFLTAIVAVLEFPDIFLHVLFGNVDMSAQNAAF